MLLVMLLTSCGQMDGVDNTNASAESTTSEFNNPISEENSTHYYGECTINDDILLEKALSREYELEDLTAFFTGSNQNGYVEGRKELLLSEVNKAFPIEVLRSPKYTVYKIKGGGYYYIFFRDVYKNGDTNSVEELQPLKTVVYYSTYISDKEEIFDWEQLKPGTSTAEDLKQLSSNTEFLYETSMPMSFTYINKDFLLVVRYTWASGENEMIINTIKVTPREQSVGCYACILEQDLP